MKIIVGLGNPGKKYVNTRHNIGFRVIDRFIKQEKLHIKSLKNREYALYRDKAVLVKPLTYMNLSGIAVNHTLRKYASSRIDDVLVVYDDVYLPLGRVRIREKGSAAGHKGLKSIIENIGSDEFARVKVGIANIPLENGEVSNSVPTEILSDYVLANFNKAEQGIMETVIDYCSQLIERFIENDYEDMVNYYSKNKLVIETT